jgi:hypothetical protein
LFAQSAFRKSLQVRTLTNGFSSLTPPSLTVFFSGFSTGMDKFFRAAERLAECVDGRPVRQLNRSIVATAVEGERKGLPGTFDAKRPVESLDQLYSQAISTIAVTP